MADSDAPGVVVVGGGVAGLVVARDLARAGLPVTVLEAADTLGGCVLAHRLHLTTAGGPVGSGAVEGADAVGRADAVDALVLDVGADSFATRSPSVADLLAELGLAADVVQPAPTGAWVHGPNGSLPLPRAGMLGIPGALWTRDVRRAVGTVGALRGTVDRVLPTRVGLRSRSLGALVRVRLGRRVLDRLVAPVVSGVHSAHPDDVDPDVVLPGARARLARHPYRPFAGGLSRVVGQMRAAAPAGSAVAGLAGGMHRMVTALAADAVEHGARVGTRADVTGLERVDDGWRLSLADGTTVAAHTVVVATPGPVAVRLLAGVVPAVRALQAPRETGVEIVTLVLDTPALDGAPRGTGVLVADGVPGVGAKALTHATAKWSWLAEAAGPGRHVLRLSYGRAGAPATVSSGTGTSLSPSAQDADRVDAALRDASTLLGVPLSRAMLVGSARAPWPAGLPHARPGHRDRVAAVRAGLAGATGLWACGAWLAGTGLASVVADARATAASIQAASIRAASPAPWDARVALGTSAAEDFPDAQASRRLRP